MIRSNPGASVYYSKCRKPCIQGRGDRSWYETEGKGKRKEWEGFEERGAWARREEGDSWMAVACLDHFLSEPRPAL